MSGLLQRPQLRDWMRQQFYRHRAVRLALHPLASPRDGRRIYDLSHILFNRDEVTAGAVQRDEALLLYALARVVRPRTVLEIGFLAGQTAFNFVQAMDADARLVSVDISETAERVARSSLAHVPRFSFHRLSQTDIGPELVDHRPVDFVFLDAAHELELNVETFRRLVPMLADGAIVAIHDTGTWSREDVDKVPGARTLADEHPEGWLPDGQYQHRRGERLFVNWILEQRPEWSVLNLHTLDVFRMGLTLVQRRVPLPVGPGGSA